MLWETGRTLFDIYILISANQRASNLLNLMRNTTQTIHRPLPVTEHATESPYNLFDGDNMLALIKSLVKQMNGERTSVCELDRNRLIP